ncbi:MAG: chemotaxis-specific protein-glutamate methyltransferase CheB [Clostridium sp.]|uniref:chemotaxis-specific protein-glutamate methyltransferase CheB n=1 Tax=Clostridium sp. TaxID=1506 RepID=UPI003F40E2BB
MLMDTKVIVIDESAFIRKVISEYINEVRGFEVVGRFRDIKNSIKQIISLKPEVIVLDLNKEEVDGLANLEDYVEKEKNAKIIVVSENSKEEFIRKLNGKLLKNIEFIYKKEDFTMDGIKSIKNELINSLEACINKEHKISYQKKEINVQNKQKEKKEYKKIDVLLIGASTGGPRALNKLLSSITKRLDIPVLIVQHMPVGFTKTFAERLDRSCKNFKVVEAEDGMSLEKNKVYIAKGGIHMCISENKTIRFDDSKSIWGVKPAVDKLFISGAKVYKGNVLACVLTGMGRDGAEGIKKIKECGGVTIAESEETCLIYGMPKAAIETGDIDYALRLELIPSKIEEWVREV